MTNIFDEDYEEMSDEVSQAVANLVTVLSKTQNKELVDENEYLQTRNNNNEMAIKALKLEVKLLKEQNEGLAKRSDLNTLALMVMYRAEKRLETKNQIEKFLDSLFVPTFEQVRIWEHLPLWICALTRYYKDRDVVLQLLQFFKWCKNLPEKADTFRLPLDWPEQDVECWLKHMSVNYVCNGKLYDWDNLEWWAPFALKDISTFYATHKGEYSEVPFQYVFMNPYMKTDKFLKMLGLEISGRHSELIRGIKMMDLDESQRALLIKSSLQRFEDDYPISEASEDYRKYLWDNLDVILDRNIIRQLYNKYCNEYTQFKDIVKLPSALIVEYLTTYPKKVGEFLASDKITTQAKKFILESLEKLYDTGEDK